MASIKRTICAAVILSCACMAACDEDAAVKIKSYAALCEASGGAMDDELCKCPKSGDDPCKLGSVCLDGRCTVECSGQEKNAETDIINYV